MKTTVYYQCFYSDQTSRETRIIIHVYCLVKCKVYDYKYNSKTRFVSFLHNNLIKKTQCFSNV